MERQVNMIDYVESMKKVKTGLDNKLDTRVDTEETEALVVRVEAGIYEGVSTKTGNIVRFTIDDVKAVKIEGTPKRENRTLNELS